MNLNNVWVKFTYIRDLGLKNNENYIFNIFLGASKFHHGSGYTIPIFSGDFFLNIPTRPKTGEIKIFLNYRGGEWFPCKIFTPADI